MRRAHRIPGQGASHRRGSLREGLPSPGELTDSPFVARNLMLKSPTACRRPEIDLFYTHCWFPACEVRGTEEMRTLEERI